MFSDTTELHIYFRRFDVDTDLPRLVQLLTEIEQADHAGEDTSEETLKAQLMLPGHDPQVLAQYQQAGFEKTNQQDIYRWQGN